MDVTSEETKLTWRDLSPPALQSSGLAWWLSSTSDPLTCLTLGPGELEICHSVTNSKFPPSLLPAPCPPSLQIHTLRNTAELPPAESPAAILQVLLPARSVHALPAASMRLTAPTETVVSNGRELPQRAKTRPMKIPTSGCQVLTAHELPPPPPPSRLAAVPMMETPPLVPRGTLRNDVSRKDSDNGPNGKR
eukprot:768792-Hanusia_phi.AAC.13